MPLTEKDVLTDYNGRINRVFQFVDENLDTDLSLSTISEIAFFSPFHFHRIFKFITGETLNDYVTRRRIEKSALDLLHKNITISEVAHRYGFSDNSSFSKAFKKFYDVSPTEFRKQNPNSLIKIRQLQSKNGQEYPDYEKYICIINNLRDWMKMYSKIEIREIPKMDLAYVSCIGPKNLENAYVKLIHWASSKELMDKETKMVTIYHNSFKVTEASKVRMSASMLLNKPIATDGDIGLTSINAGKTIVGSFEIGLNEFEKAWKGLFLWMNEKGHYKADGNPFEIYHNNFNLHPERKAVVDFYIPIV